jgi:alkanesulfonate monooxygenase SsuD/methylene tetrahydromethanopterin reductase-like flavin-dependent oxidoreductase (luciferase family)
VLEWARRAEEGPFSSIGVLDRVAYDSYDPFVSLAAMAAATRRVKLATTIVVAPLRPTAILAKEAASIDALSGGRLVLGVAVGARVEDYEVAQVDPRTRGVRFDRQLRELREMWESNRVGPSSGSDGGPRILLGGTFSDKAFLRMVSFGDGFIHGGGPPKVFARYVDKARAAWNTSGRPGRPEIWGQGYFALTDKGAGIEYLRDYYAYLGPFSEKIAESVLSTPQAVVQYIRAYEDAGCDELVLLPAVAKVAELDALTDVLEHLR